MWQSIIKTLNSSSTSINSGEIEELFGQAVVRKQNLDEAKSQKSSQKDNASKFLDSKTTLNMSIALRPFKKSPEMIASLILACNSTELETDKLKTLQLALPDPETVSTVFTVFTKYYEII